VAPTRLGLCATAALSLAALGERPAKCQEIAGDDDHKDIIVTAQRRPELSHNVPISLTARSGDDLERMQATDTGALGKIAPSLTMTRTGPFTQPYLRGVGKRSTLGVENAVATYVDGVYMASSIGALLDLRGIERVEVLNGPQGTLFGRNSTGGVIQVITRDPSPEASGEAELQASSYEYGRGDLYLTGGTDALAGNLAMSLSHNGGYGTNLFSGSKDQGEVNHSLVGRSKWVWRLAPTLKVTLAGDYQDVDQDFSNRPVAGFEPIGQPRVHGFWNGDQDASNRFRFRYGGASIKAEASVAGLELMSLSALRRVHARYSFDLDLGPLPLLSGVPKAEQDQFSQELQFQSNASSRVKWLAGIYYLHIQEQYDPTTFAYGGSYSALLGGRVSQTLFSSGTASAYAAYGQATLPVAEKTRLTLGLRYTIERRSIEAYGERRFNVAPFVRNIPGLPLPGETPFRDVKTFREPMWRASLDRDLSDQVIGYVSASRGFQSGGWNLQTPQNPAFDPETLDDFEAGLKYADRSGRLTADANVFYYDYSDIQVSIGTPLGSATSNATSAGVYGFEIQLEARPDDSTDLSFGAQLLRARFREFPNATCTDFTAGAPIPYAPISCDVTGNDLPFAPDFKFNAEASRRLTLGRFGSLSLSGNVAYNSGYFSEPDNVVRQKPYATADIFAEWHPARKGPTIRLWVRNLTNARYYNNLVTFPTAGVLQSPAAPRRFGASIAQSF
jgi:outer membrane receptor protein involved in Fe transport